MRSKAHTALTAPLVLHHTSIYKRAMKKIIINGQMWNKLTINAPLILKMRDIIFFFAGKLHNGPFQGIFRGGQDFFDP
jgi:hypothetical protein